MGYISDTARNRTHNLFRPKWELTPLGHSDGHCCFVLFFLGVTVNRREASLKTSGRQLPDRGLILGLTLVNGSYIALLLCLC